MAEEKLPNWLKNRAHLSPDRPAIEFEGIRIAFLNAYLIGENGWEAGSKGSRSWRIMRGLTPESY